MARPSRLSDAEVQQRLGAVPKWTRRDDAITRTFSFSGFPAAVAFVQRLVAPAEAMGHHPDVDLRYDKVIVTLSTHDQGGLTAFDFDLAAKLDAF
jgi:4a-hydroxytetrahydrobiopterin dehydratase